MRRAGALGGLGCIALASACAGESFGLADDASSQGGSAFPPLSNTDHDTSGAGAAGAGGSSSAAGSAGRAGSSSGAGRGGSGSSRPTPLVNACGELRSGTSSDDGEVCIPPGTFNMGNSEVAVPQGYTAHGPVHEVTLGAFALGTKEVTVARYRACVSAGVCVVPLTATEQGCTYSASSSADRLPITCVSWDDAVTFCDWDGHRRLPTEAEWERAARGTDGRNYAWGNNVACTNAIFGGLLSCRQYYGLLPRAVGSAPLGAAAEGALDLTGNAWEWVADWFGAYSSAAEDNPTGPDMGSARIQRGGNWQTPPSDAMSFMRRAEAPAAIGPSSFRCARSTP